MPNFKGTYISLDDLKARLKKPQPLTADELDDQPSTRRVVVDSEVNGDSVATRVDATLKISAKKPA